MDFQEMTSCRICGRELTDPVSVYAGIGPVCRLKGKEIEYKMKDGNLFSNRAKYDFGIIGNVIWIKDLGGFKSVTNDIEEVLSEILKEVALEGMKIMYRDSMNIWDEVRPQIVGKRVTSVSFHSIGEKEMSKAMAVIQHRSIN